MANGFSCNCLPHVKVGIAEYDLLGFVIYTPSSGGVEWNVLDNLLGGAVIFTHTASADLTFPVNMYSSATVSFSHRGILVHEGTVNPANGNMTVTTDKRFAFFPASDTNSGSQTWNSGPNFEVTRGDDFWQIRMYGNVSMASGMWDGVDGSGDPVFTASPTTAQDVEWIWRVELSGTVTPISTIKASVKTLLDAIDMDTQEFAFEVVPAPTNYVSGVPRNDTYTDAPKALSMIAINDNGSVTYQTAVINDTISLNTFESGFAGAMRVPGWGGILFPQTGSGFISQLTGGSGTSNRYPIATSGSAPLRGRMNGPAKGYKSCAIIPRCGFNFYVRNIEYSFLAFLDTSFVDSCAALPYSWTHKRIAIGQTLAGYETPSGYDWDTLSAANQFVQISETSCP